MSNKAPKDQEQRNAEADVESFANERGPFVVAAETTRMPMVFADAKPDHPIIFANDSFLKLTGYERDELLAQNFNFLLADRTDGAAVDQIAAAFASQTDESPEIHYRRKDGSEFWATLFVNDVRDKHGSLIQHFVSLIDTTRYKLAQENAGMLIDELNHRVKNTLATVQSIVSQAVRNSTDPKVVRESIETRIAALARSHDLLGRDKWDGAGLHDLVDQTVEPFSVAGGTAQRFKVKGENVRLSPKGTLALGIAFHELATNAVKYGALSNESGTIAIGWTIEPGADGRRLCLQWLENGGPAVTPPSRRGFGSRVIEYGLPHELGGTVELAYLTTGIVCTIDVPVPLAMLDG